VREGTKKRKQGMADGETLRENVSHDARVRTKRAGGREKREVPCTGRGGRRGSEGREGGGGQKIAEIVSATLGGFTSCFTLDR